MSFNLGKVWKSDLGLVSLHQQFSTSPTARHNNWFLINYPFQISLWLLLCFECRRYGGSSSALWVLLQMKLCQQEVRQKKTMSSSWEEFLAKHLSSRSGPCSPYWSCPKVNDEAEPLGSKPHLSSYSLLAVSLWDWNGYTKVKINESYCFKVYKAS